LSEGMCDGKGRHRRIRVLYIISSLVVGGAEGQLVRLVTQLDRSRFDVAVCCLSTDGPYRETLDAAGIPVMTMGFYGFGELWSSPSRVLRPLYNLVRFIRRFRPDVVHGVLFWAYVLGTFAARLAGVPAVVTSRRSLGIFKASKPRHLFLERVANRLTDVIVANSCAVRDDTVAQERVPPEKVKVIYNGIEADRYQVPPDDRLRQSLAIAGKSPVVAVVANLIHYKGHHFFIDAWATVTRTYPNAVALLIGDGPTRRELEARVEAEGLSQSVRFLGTRRDVPDLLALADVVVHPSLEEGFANAILEAMAAGKAVVATSVGGNPEAVVAGVTGLLVPPRDSNTLAEALLWLLEHPVEATAFGIAGRERIGRHFDLQAMVHAYEQLYEQLVLRRGAIERNGAIAAGGD
jgi:glycosyltransferase involved in cell wall biosynthesis